jgi:hypothetical protein
MKSQMAQLCEHILDCKYFTVGDIERRTHQSVSFVLLWSTWFQITIFDVRFAQDSVFERFCKIYQFLAFVLLAAVGASFDPAAVGAAKDYRIYQALTLMLGITRIVLAIQYTVVACFVVPKYRNVLLPFMLTIGVYLISGATFLGVRDKSLNPFGQTKLILHR